MVSYDPTDVIPIHEFEFAWRITDAKWSVLPEKILNRIKPLSESKSKELLESSPCGLDLGDHFDEKRYCAARRVSLEENNDSEAEQVSRRLRELPIPSNQEVYLCWQVGDGVAAVTDWGTFTAIWNELWYPFDRLCVFDESHRCAVLFGPEEHAVFIKARTPSVATA